MRTAPIVLLFLSAGFEERDLSNAKSPEGQAYYARSRTGNADLPSEIEHAGFFAWSKRILNQFGVDYPAARSKVAFLNISPYKSKRFDDWHMLAALPSCRVAINHAQRVLFPEARQGKRTVVCLRSAKWWGLKRGESYPGRLFAPMSGMSGMIAYGDERETMTTLVRDACR